jgi:hypothetical protein
MHQSRVAIAFLVLGCAGAFGAGKKIIAPPGTKPGGNYRRRPPGGAGEH